MATEKSSEICQVEHGRRVFPAKAVMLGMCFGIAVGVSVTLAITQMPATSHSMTDNALIEFAEDKKNKSSKKEKVLPKAEECSLATTQNCAKSQCCDNFGFQCYSKNKTFAACLKKCDPQHMATGGNGTWSCQELGVRTRCATTKENCLPYGCCADAGYQCYAKDDNWGQCMMSCDPGTQQTVDKSKWWCAPIGPRNFADYKGDFIPGFTEVEPWVKNCTPLGQNCASTKCCAWTGYKCYEKNATWASCLSSCHPKKVERRCV